MTGLREVSTDLMAWLTGSALPLWWEKGADHRRGGFHEALDERGEPVEAHRRARVQARQIYVYATAGALGWNGPWRHAVAHGLSFFLGYYQRADGTFRTVVAADGSPVDDSAWLYDQAFALFALAQAGRVLPERLAELKARALILRAAIETWRWPEGGFREPPAAYDHQSNPHMHLLEASLAWAEVDQDPIWSATADDIVALAMSRFIDAEGALHEFFAPGWGLAEGVDGRIVEPGHQFEWAWLLERWSRLRDREDAHEAAVRLFKTGQAGVDRARGVANQQMLDDGSVHDAVARLWPQTEWIKAAVIHGDEAAAVAGAAGLKLYLDKPGPGLWRDKLKADGSFVAEPAPASSFYHIVCAIFEIRSAAR
jgi:mannose-6-phosphate isomerase